jgi:transcriptional regulator with XRE-family HTH domain
MRWAVKDDSGQICATCATIRPLVERQGGDARFGSLGERIRLRREKLGLKAEPTAHRVERSKRWLNYLETGKVDPTLGDLLAIADVLRMDLDELLADVRHPRPSTVSSLGTMAPDEEAEAKRREFLAFIAAAGSGLIDFERLTVPVVDAAYLRDAEALTNALLGRWYTATPSMLLPPVLAHLRGLQRSLPGPPTLENLTARTAVLVAQLFDKVELPAQARANYALAESLARDTGDLDLLAVSLVLRSGLHSWRRTADRRPAFGLVAEAAAAISDGSPQLLKTLVMARMAEERARAGDGHGFMRDMESAEAALQSGADHWYGPRDAAELAAVRGASELVLGRRREAAETLSWTLARMSPSAVNWRAVVTADRDAALAAS